MRVDFSGGSISSNGGALLLREVDRKLGLTTQMARALRDRRQREKVRHEVVTMVRHRVGYLVGLARNAVLERKVEVACEGAERGFQATGRKCRVFTEVQYGAGAWRRPRRVIARIEHGPRGRNPRFIVTNLDGQAKALYERVYYQRGEMENRIKEQQLDLFADRTSSPRWWTNQYRMALAALAYTVFETMRRTALRGTALTRAQCRTLRLRLLKLGTVVTRNTRTVAVRLSSTCPDQAMFRLLVHQLTAG